MSNYGAGVATPEFIVALRSKIGHEPLWLPGVTAVVFGGERVLLVRRADTGAWTPVTGIIDPGEEPAAAARREVAEEACVDVEVQSLAWVHTLPPMEYSNGDRAQYLDLVFRCSYRSGTPAPGDGENTETGWFGLDQLPPMTESMRERIAAARSDPTRTRFDTD